MIALVEGNRRPGQMGGKVASLNWAGGPGLHRAELKLPRGQGQQKPKEKILETREERGR